MPMTAKCSPFRIFDHKFVSALHLSYARSHSEMQVDLRRFVEKFEQKSRIIEGIKNGVNNLRVYKRWTSINLTRYSVLYS